MFLILEGETVKFFRASSNLVELPCLSTSMLEFSKEIEGLKNLPTLKFKKEYVLYAGGHAAIISRVETGLEYLELQAPEAKRNGWSSFEVYGSIEGTLK